MIEHKPKVSNIDEALTILKNINVKECCAKREYKMQKLIFDDGYIEINSDKTLSIVGSQAHTFYFKVLKKHNYKVDDVDIYVKSMK